MSRPFFAGIDVGGTNIKVGLVSADGEVIADDKFPTLPDQPPRPNLESAAKLVHQLIDRSGLDKQELKGAGLATPGPMDVSSGLILTPFNLPGWRNHNVRQTMSELLDQPVVFSNDAGAAGFGEFWIGRGSEFNSVILVTLGTGVGGGIIIDGRSIDGAHSHGAEIGHLIVDSSPNARHCSCGKPGHLEAYSSATAIVKITAEKMNAGQSSLLSNVIDENSPLSSLKIYHAAQQGDELAKNAITETANYLGIAITSLAHAIDPQAVLLGGAMNFGGNESEIGSNFLGTIQSYVKQYAMAVIADKLVIDFATLGSDAGFIGAAGLAKHEFFDNAVSV